VILYGREYWDEIVNFEALVRHGMIDRADLKLFQYADQPRQALELLQTALGVAAEEATPAFAHSRTCTSRSD
jgi:predicted Rossmann-fold nucleotide-binding protein